MYEARDANREATAYFCTCCTMQCTAGRDGTAFKRHTALGYKRMQSIGPRMQHKGPGMQHMGPGMQHMGPGMQCTAMERNTQLWYATHRS